MNEQERQYLADSYMHAWQAVKGEKIKVTIKPCGWFDRAMNVGFGQVMVESMRATDLLKGIAALTAQLANKQRG